MRTVIFVTVFAFAAVSAASRLPWEEIRAAESVDDLWALLEEPDDAVVALEARCGDLTSWERRSCEESLVARFSAGDVTPQSVLRLHCTRIDSVWTGAPPEPPALCANRFGGWLSG